MEMLLRRSEYSEAELRLIHYFHVGDLRQHVPPYRLYEMMVAEAFINNDQSAYAGALRRAFQALNKGVHRMTPTFEALLEIEE